MKDASRPAAPDPAFLAGGGELGHLIRARDWSATSLGPIEDWPPSLRTILGFLLRSPVPLVLMWGEDGVMLYNDAYSAFAGGRHPALLGSRVREGWPEVADFNDHVMRVGLAGGTLAFRDQELTLHRNGVPEQVWMNLDYSPVPGEDGEPAGVLCILAETTGQVAAERSREQAEAALRAERDRSQGVLDNMGEAFVLLDREFRIVDMNAEAMRLEKRPKEDILCKTHWVAHPDAAPELGELFRQGMRERRPVSMEHRYVWPDGRDTWIDTRVYPAGEGLAVFYRDATERKRAEAAVRASDDRQRFLIALADEVRGLADPGAVVAATSRALGQRLAAARVAYAEIDQAGDRATIRGGWTDGTVAPLPAELRLSDFGATMIAMLRSGATVRVDDVAQDPRMADGLAALDAIGVSALVSVPLVKDGRFALNLNVHRAARHEWEDAEVALIEAVAERTWGAVERARAEEALRASEARLSFLDRLSAETSSLADADSVLRATTRLLGEHLGLSVCAYADMDDDQDGFTIRGDWAAPGSRSIVGHYSLAAFGRLAVKNLGAGEPLVVNDNLRELAPEEAATFQGIGIAATICMPLVKGGRLTALMAIHDRAPRVWTEDELALLREVTERSWAHVERVRAVAGLRESEVQFRAFAQAVPNHVWAAGPDGSLYWFNDRVYAYCGEAPGSLDGAEWARIVHPEDQAAAAATWARALTTGEVYETEFRIRRGDDAYRWFLVRAEPVRGADGAIANWVGTNTDIEDAKRQSAELAQLNATLEHKVEERTRELMQAEEALRQSQKMEAMGSLTGGVAHDFNNLLTPILGSLDMLLRRGVGNERERRLMDGALQSAERAKTLVQRLLAFARRQPLQPGPVDLDRLVHGMAGLLGSTLGPRIDVRVEMPADLPPALADANQLEMALLNLAVNARDAMPEGGVLTVSAKRESVRPGHALVPRSGHSSGLRPGHYLRLSVTDTGAGMDEATLTRAVEPFFSTKGVGRGTGLGLSMVHGLAEQLHGGLKIRSRPGQGTTVDLWLPISPFAPEPDHKDSSAETPRQARGTALLVDDEDLVRMSTADMLMDLGYEVVEAASAEQALRLVGEGLRPELVVTDHLMPGASGVDLARELRADRPDLPVLIVSGYAEMEGIAPGLPRLTKPFRQADLLQSLAALGREA